MSTKKIYLILTSFIFGTIQTYQATLFITGGAGFIGSNTVRYFFDTYEDYRIIVLDALTYAGSLNNIPNYIKESPRFIFVKGSILDRHTVDDIMAQSTYVIHLAAESDVTRSIENDDVFLKTNILGTEVLLQALRKHSDTIQRFIYVSTSEVYGTAQELPMTEEHLLNPRSPYAASKAAADRLVYAYCCTYNVPVVTVRPFNNYGPCQHYEKVIPNFITNALNDEPLSIEGDGTQTRDWLYVTDTIRFFDILLHYKDFSALEHQVFNIGSGRMISVIDLAYNIVDLIGASHDLITFTRNRPGQVNEHLSSFEKAQRICNWKPSVSLEEGLGQTISWYKNKKTKKIGCTKHPI